MLKPRHTEEERLAITERTLTDGLQIAEIAAEEGILRQTMRGLRRAPMRDKGRCVEVTAPRATVLELSLADGTVFMIRG